MPLGALAPVAGTSEMQVLLVKACVAFVPVFTVTSTITDRRMSAGTAAVVIVFTLAAGVVAGGSVSSAAGNPVGVLGPMIKAGTFPVWFF